MIGLNPYCYFPDYIKKDIVKHINGVILDVLSNIYDSVCDVLEPVSVSDVYFPRNFPLDDKYMTETFLDLYDKIESSEIEDFTSLDLYILYEILIERKYSDTSVIIDYEISEEIIKREKNENLKAKNENLKSYIDCKRKEVWELDAIIELLVLDNLDIRKLDDWKEEDFY